MREAISQQQAGPLIDAHCHLGRSPAGVMTASQLLEHLDQNGMALAVISPGRVDDASAIPTANDMIVEAVRAHPKRFIGFGLADPTCQADAGKELTRVLDAGLAGLKLRPGTAGFASAQRALRSVVQVAAKRHVPVYLHSGSQLLSVVKDAVHLATEFPQLPIILSYRKSPAFEPAGEVAVKLPNLYFDTSSLPAGHIADVLHLVGEKRLIFGSGFPFGSLRVELSKAYRAVPPEAVPLVFGGNIRAVLASCGIQVPA